MRARLAFAVALATASAGLFVDQPTTDALDSLDPDRSKSMPRQSARHAQAGVKPWVVIAKPNLGVSTPDMVRVGKRIHVVWGESHPGGPSVRSRVLTALDNPVGRARNVVANWVTLSNRPQIFRHGQKLYTVFAGVRSFAGGEPYAGQASFSTSSDGLAWRLSTGSLSQSTAAGNSGSLDAIDGAGLPFFAMGDFDSHVIMHRGVDPDQPASAPDFFSATQACCANVDVSLANDRGTKNVWVSWFSLGSSDPDTAGVFAQQVWPRPNGPLFQAPGSATPGGDSSNPGQPIAMAERAGGDIWIAYLRGYPTSHVIRMWKVGTKKFWDFDTKTQIATLDLATGPGGRLWLSWWALDDRTIRAARTNPAVTRFGTVRKVRLPGGPSGQLNSYTSDGSAGPLDVVAASQPPGSGTSGVYAVHLLPGLTVKASPKRLAQGQLTITVTDAGQPVRGAKVTFRGHHATTNARGKAQFAISPAVPDGRYAISVAKPGYAKGATRVTVT
jgi:hypothetical protein